MKKNTTKRALWMSALSLFLCFSMLVGTTFAWFTDEVTSNVNTIIAGNLDVNLYHTDSKESNKPVKADTLLFDDVNPALWEPGALAYEILTVANDGTLALKYQLSINFENATEVNGKTLADALKVAVVEGGFDEGFDRAYLQGLTYNESLESFVLPGQLAAGETKTYGIVVYWEPTDNDNDFNVKETLSIDLGVKLVATQLTAESDSFGNDYDDGAFLPVAPEAIPDAGNDLVLNGSAESKTAVTVPAAVAEELKEAGVKGLAVEASAPVIDTKNKTVSYTTVELVDQDGNEVDLSATTAKVTVKLYVGDAFANDEQVEVYHDGAFVTYATVANGYISYEVSHFCEVSITAAEEVVLDNTIDSVKEFMAFAAAVNGGKNYKGETVVLGADLDLAGVTWTPIGTSSNPFKGTFDGNGKVIKNLSVLMAGKSNVGLFGFTTEGEIKNVTVQNAKVAGRLNVAVVAGTPYTSKYTNINVLGHVEVDGMAYVGGVAGKNAYANWNNITVDVDATSYVNANSVENGTAYRTYVGGVVGFNGEGGHTFKNITSNIAVIGSTCDIGGAFGIAHYGNQFENVTVTGTVTGAEGAYEVGGIAGVWNNGGANVVFTNCNYTGKLPIVGAAYGAGTGKLIVNGVEVVASAAALKAALNVTTGDATVELFCDINMKGTAWTPIYVDGYKGAGVVTIEGNGATIKGLTAPLFAGGFAGKSGIVIKNLTIADSNIVSTSGLGGGAFIDTADSMHVITLENCHLVNSTVSGERVGGLIGWCSGYAKLNDGPVKAYVTISNCSVVDSTVTGAGSAGAIAGHPGASDYTWTTIENCTVKNVKVVSNDDGSWRTGAIVGTANNGHVVINNVTVEDVTLTQNGVTAESVVLFGRFVPAGTGTLVIDGATVVTNADELAAAVKNGVTNLYLADGEYNVANCGGKTLTISGSKGAVLKIMNEGEDGVDYGFDSSNVTFNGVTINTTANTGNYKGYCRMTATFNDCDFFGAYASFQNSTFNNCTFDFNNGYFWTWGANELTFNGCTFNGKSKTILAHGSASTVININNCAFDATEKGYTGGGDWTAAVEMDPTSSNTYTINFTGENTLSENYSGWTRVKDGTTGHVVNGLN